MGIFSKKNNEEEEELFSYAPIKKKSAQPAEEEVISEEPSAVNDAADAFVAEDIVSPEETASVIEEISATEAEITNDVIEETAAQEVEHDTAARDDSEVVDRTHIFEHKKVYYDDNTIILPRNFESRLRQSSDELKTLYSQIKNVLMEYSGVKCRMLKYVEVFRCGGAVAKIKIKGKSLYLYLKLDPESVDHDYLKVVDMSHHKTFEETPSEIKVTGKRKCKRSIEMIRLMMDALNIGKRRRPENIDYLAEYPYISNAVIRGKNMIKR